MICLDMLIENNYNNHLYKIFKNINLTNYEWEVVFEETHFQGNSQNNSLFGEHNIVNSENFVKYILKTNYNIIEMDLKGYPIGSERSIITTFSDFMKSSCEMIFLCYDCIYVEFYCKNTRILEQVYKNCVNEGYKKIALKFIEDVRDRNNLSAYKF